MKFKSILTAFILLASCSKDKGITCTTCTESKSGYSQEYCGSPKEVKTFQDELKRQGKNIGQNWSCR